MNSQSAIDIQLASLIETSQTLKKACRETCTMPLPIWLKVSHALDHINKEIAGCIGGAQ